MHVILTGATGLVGSGVLDAMIRMKDITKISVISRRPVAMAEDAKDPRVNVIIHRDFGHYPQSLLDQVADATGCVWALGISQAEVSKEDYIKITKDYTLAAAKAFSALPSSPSLSAQPFHFVFVTGAGTTHAPGMFTSLFGRVKGEAELLLADVQRANPRFRVSSVRAGFVDWRDHEAIRPYISPRPFQRTWTALTGPVFRNGLRGLWSPTGPLGEFLARGAMGRWEAEYKKGAPGCETVGDSGMVVVDNWGFRKMAGLDT